MLKSKKNDSVLVICVQEVVEDGSEMNIGVNFNSEEIDFLHHAFIADTLTNVLDLPSVDFQLFYSDLPNTKNSVKTIIEYLSRKLKGKKSKLLTNGLIITPLPAERWGIRMDMIFQQCFSDGYQHVLLVGSRTPSLNSKMLKQAMRLLKKSDAIFGPTVEGRYYLLGMSEKYHFDLSAFDWKSPNIYSEVAEHFREKGLSWTELELWYAVEHEEDLEYLVRDINQYRLEGDEICAKETEKVLERILNNK
jgi:glycosyltransferase A (GT-A) superfamily protein (DUF2064 family)